MVRRSTMRRVRKGKRRPRATGFIVTWDVDSADTSMVNRTRRFVFGDTANSRGRNYRYPGFIEREGVRYLGQSVAFVPPNLLAEIDGFLTRTGVEHEITPATIG